MIKNENNCFKIIEYNYTKITFDISEISSDIIGNCEYYGKTIYNGQYECIDKPNNTNDDINEITHNIGGIENCHEACSSCLGERNSTNTNCIECAQGYFKTEDSKTNCIKNGSISLHSYYLNITDNIYYHCYNLCKSCSAPYNPTMNEMNCIECIDDYYFIYGENNCYNSTIFQNNKFYFNNNDSKFHKCFHSCSECFNVEPNEENHSCIKCADNYYKFEMDLFQNNCYDNETIKLLNQRTLNYSEYISNNSDYANFYEQRSSNSSSRIYDYISIISDFSCPPGYFISNNKCILKEFDSWTKLNEFKNEIQNNIASYVNSSKVINGSNFIAVVLSSDDMDPEKQLSNGISAIDLGNCTNVLKESYNISKEENLIVLNMESKNEEKNTIDDKSFTLGKNNQLEIYDYSGRKLNLSFCKEDIKVMKYLGEIEKYLDMNSAKTFSEQGIDVFNVNDEFFNDICHKYDNLGDKDIILTDRRNEIYQNATFCQEGCIYIGINYELNAENCICNSYTLQKNNITNNNSSVKASKFDELTKTFISSLLSFNINVLKCYKLTIDIKILIHNIGFYSLSSMLFLQTIFFFVKEQKSKK